MEYKIVEKFISIDGEGSTAGELAVFVRLYDCNLTCSWCDTKYSFDDNERPEILSADEIVDYIKGSGISNVTITGGEPLVADNIEYLLERLDSCHGLKIHVETNGSLSLKDLYRRNFKNISFVIDYKLPLSGMESFMSLENLELARKDDVYKFVIAGEKDLLRAFDIINNYRLREKCSVHLSPALGFIEPCHIVDFMKKKSLTGVKLQLQLHKFIWPSVTRGV